MAWRWAVTLGAMLLVLALPVRAQTEQPAAVTDAADEAPAFDDDELDALVAPVALYPDALLAQVFVASTYPLDVIKANRLVSDVADQDADALAAALEGEGFDPSITVLAQGFPTVITRMSDDIDWTETLGDAVLVQTDDVLDAVQRQRARAQAVGNLDSNEAQVVTVEDDAITIAPADPEIVYVPSYDPALAYTQPAPQPPVVYAQPTDPGYSGGELIATGVVAFGAGMLVNEVFSDDDDWDDYWRGPPPVRWGNDSFYPRPGRGGINAGGDVNINVDRGRDNNLRVDRDRVTSIDRDGAWRPDPRRQSDARQKLDTRRGGDGAARAVRPERTAAAAGGNRAAMQSKLQARSGGDAKAIASRGGGNGAGAKLRDASAAQRAKPKDSAFGANKDGLAKTKAASQRGKASAAKAGGGGKLAAAKHGGGGKIAKPSGKTKAAVKAGGHKGGAFKKGGGQKAAARGKRSGGGKFKGRRG